MQERNRRAVKVAHLQRGVYPGYFSVERIFDDVRGALPKELEVDVWVDHRLNRGLIPRFLSAYRARRGKHDVKHVLGDAQFLAWFLPSDQTLLTVLDCVSLKRLTGWRRAVFRALWYSWPLKKARHVSTLSEFVRQDIIKLFDYPPAKISVIPPPLSPEFKYCAPRPHENWRRVLQIGSAAVKNRIRVIEALAGLDITLVTVGEVSSSEQRAIADKRIRHEAHKDLSRSELLDVYRGIDILLFPSTYEGFGMPVIEAQAVGRPVVTSNIEPMSEASGGAACLVDPMDVGSIRAGVLRILEDKKYAESLISAGVENARRYEVRAIAERYAQLYREVAGV